MDTPWICIDTRNDDRYIRVHRDPHGVVECIGEKERNICQGMESTECLDSTAFKGNHHGICMKNQLQRRFRRGDQEAMYNRCSLSESVLDGWRKLNQSHTIPFPSMNVTSHEGMNLGCFSVNGKECTVLGSPRFQGEDRIYFFITSPFLMESMMENRFLQSINIMENITIPSSTIPSQEMSTTNVLIISLSIACVILAAWIGFLLHRRRQQELHDHESKTYEQMMETNEPPLNLSFLEIYRMDSNDLIINQHLGTGGFADVYLGTVRGSPVAVKTIIQNHPTKREVKLFTEEIQLMSMLHSPYIVEFIGVCWRNPGDIKCVLEYMDLGDLRDYLTMSNGTSFPWHEKIRCFQCIVDGLTYLHDYPIIHRDLKSRNILMDSQKGTKLSDFGTSREQTANTMTAGVRTYRWMAPEVILSHHYTTAADIYSLGMLLTEFDTHDIPFVNVRAPGTDKVLPDVTIMGMIISNSIQVEYSTSMPVWLADLGRACVSRDPSMRPTTNEISSILLSHV